MRFINETATPGKSILREFAGLSSEFDPFVGASVECALLGVWRSPVARVLWEHDVAGSNPVTPTKPAHSIMALWPSGRPRLFRCGSSSAG